MQKIYILQGTTGEYSDRTDWIVRAYTDEAKAIGAQMDVTDALARLWKLMEEKDIHYYDLYDHESLDSETKELYQQVSDIDPKFQMDYTGTSWWVKECELV